MGWTDYANPLNWFKSDKQQASTMTGEQSGALNNLLNKYQGDASYGTYYDQLAKSQPNIQAQAFNPAQYDVSNIVNNWQQQNPAYQYKAGNLGIGFTPQAQTYSAGTYAPSTQVNDALTREYWQKSIADPARQNFQQNVLPQIQEQQGKNFWKSARLKQQGDALANMESGIQGQLGNLLYQDEQQRRALGESAAQRQFQANQQAQQLGAQSYNTTQGLMGDIARANQQAGLQQEQYGLNAGMAQNQQNMTGLNALIDAAKQNAAFRQQGELQYNQNQLQADTATQQMNQQRLLDLIKNSPDMLMQNLLSQKAFENVYQPSGVGSLLSGIATGASAYRNIAG